MKPQRLPFPPKPSHRVAGAVLALAISSIPAVHAQDPANPTLRPPSVPLVAHDPYFSIWSPGDKLTDADTTHWTGKRHRLNSGITVDGTEFRIMGAGPADTHPMAQTGVSVLPTRTIYTFEGKGVALTLTFITPALPGDVDLLSRPLTYVHYELRSTDGAKHQVSFDFKASSEIATNQGEQKVTATLDPFGDKLPDLTAVRVGSVDQQVLAKKGDDLRIDWGYLYLAADEKTATAGAAMRDGGAMVKEGEEVAAASAVASLSFKPFEVADAPVSRTLMIGYDDEYSIQYMKQNLRPFWRRNGWEAADLFKAAVKEFPSLKTRCEEFDMELMADLTRAGGPQYAKIGALAFRQCFAAGKFVADENGQPLSFCKENHSNGCIATSDVFYPMAPQFLLFGPTVAKSFLVPFMNYAASERWKFPFAPHDLGTYPQANGQVYGDGERGVNNQMPVEESGNLLLLMAAVAEMEGSADFAGLYWKQLEQWAEYLKQKGFDPENQLCTDDFAGHLAHNVNLSAKAICGLGAFAKLCEMRGEKAKASEYSELARSFAKRWIKEADDGEKFRLAFDRPGTWSQKYNLMWDRILGLDLFPAEVLTKEMTFYRSHQNRFGLPLDNRETYTKLDWILWTATLTQNRADFDALVDPVFQFLNETPDLAPMPDWYQTKTAKKEGFTARPVVGGVFAQMLYDKPVWKKWASRDVNHAVNWAAMPVPPVVSTLVPAADTKPVTWNYTLKDPGDGWQAAGFDDSKWSSGMSGFGTAGTPGAIIGTVWNTRSIWVRREFSLPADHEGEIELWMKHDEDAVVYLNGVLACRSGGWVDQYESFKISAAARATLKPGTNVIAIQCKQTANGQYIDAGLVTLKVPDKAKR